MTLSIGFNDVNFVNVTIAGEIIMWVFVGVAILTFVIFLFNLIFIRPGSRNKKVVDPETAKAIQEFEQQKADVEAEIALILKVENEKRQRPGH